MHKTTLTIEMLSNTKILDGELHNLIEELHNVLFNADVNFQTWEITEKGED